MQTFLTAFTWDIVFYAMASFWHAFFTMSVGWFTAFWIMYKQSTYTAETLMVNGFKLLLFGVLVGTVDYMGGNAIKGNMSSVLWSMGFLEHTSVTTTDSEQITLAYNDGSTTSTTTISADEVDATLDYEKLMYMQDEWFNFFAIQRGVQLLAPYLLMFAIEAAISSILVLGLLFL